MILMPFIRFLHADYDLNRVKLFFSSRLPVDDDEMEDRREDETPLIKRSVPPFR